MNTSSARAAISHLRTVDPILSRLIKAVGPCRLKPKNTDTFESLLKAIVYQQLNGKAASAICGRVLALFAVKTPTPKHLLNIPEASLRNAGLSANKLAAVRDLALKCLSGGVAPRKQLEPLSDAEIIARLTQVRGVGEWTAQMFLIFNLGRPDVLPTGDFGVRKAFGLLYRKNGRLPPPSVLDKHGRIWAPYRTTASWYLWQHLAQTSLHRAHRRSVPSPQIAASDL